MTTPSRNASRPIRYGGRGLPAALLSALLSATLPHAAAQTAPAPATGSTAPYEQVDGGIFDASDPPAIVRFMQQLGYQAQLSSEANGSPVILGRISRSDYTIQFYECENGRFCNSVQLMAASPAPFFLSLEQLNGFNARWRYVRATLVDDKVRLQMDVNVDAGVTADNLRDTLDIWRRLLEVFERDILNLS
ncbi:MAG: YbjN domain-containing protein [Hyphomonadaceae bacterium]